GKDVLNVDPEALKLLAKEALHDTSHYLRADHLEQLAKILKDGEASDNDKFVAMELLKNANIAAGGVLPMCQDTGTAIVFAKKGQQVWTGGGDEAALSEGICQAYAENNLRYSQMAPLDMYEEVNTGNNLPAQIDIMATDGDAYKLMFIAKGGGSANKAFLYQETKALLNPDRLFEFLEEKLLSIGTAACPPYHLALVVGGTSAEMCMKTMKLASCHYLDNMPTSGNKHGQAFRDLETEAKLLELAQRIGVGAQFGGKYFAHDVRVIRMPRHGASCPVSLGVSCSADRQIKAKITKDGVFLEELERNPAKHLPEVTDEHLGGDVVEIDLNKPMAEVLKTLSQYPIRTRLSLSGSLIVARDIAHAKLKERLDAGEGLPDYFKENAVYYAGPAKTPEGMPSGSFGPTTAGRMDSYVEQFQAA
ncbi:MAG: fumarate hydratase, partial [Rhodospirillales bacterium]